MLKALRGLMAFAITERLIDVDPTGGYKPTRIKDTGGFIPWTDIDIAKFEATHPIGSRARLALALLLFTGQRRGDIVRIGRQHIRDGILSLKQNKTGAQSPSGAAARPRGDAERPSHLSGQWVRPTLFSGRIWEMVPTSLQPSRS